MNIEDSPLYEEIQAIIKSPNPVHARYHCNIILEDETIAPLKLFSIDILRNYLTNFSDEVILEAAIPAGIYQFKILPQRENLKIELIRNLVGEVGSDPVKDDEPSTRTYKAVIQNEASGAASASDAAANASGTADLTAIVSARFQLLDPALEQIRASMVGGIYYDIIPGDVIRYTLSDLNTKLKLSSAEKVKGVNIVPYDNKKVYRQVIVPHGTKPQDVANIIQNDQGGVYNAGMGCYLQDGLWYIWPTFNTTRYSKERKALLMINIPSNKFPGIERTYRLQGSAVIALSTGTVNHQDTSNQDQLNLGNATRFTHTDQLWKGANKYEKNFGESGKDNKFIIKRTDNSSEYAAIDRDGSTNAPLSAARLRNNSFVEPSKLAARNGSVMTLTWEYSKPELVYPGMPMRLQYLKEGTVIQLDGTVVGAHHYIHDTTIGPVQGKHVCNTALSVFIQNLILK
jgi:hypothetical protein